MRKEIKDVTTKITAEKIKEPEFESLIDLLDEDEDDYVKCNRMADSVNWKERRDSIRMFHDTIYSDLILMMLIDDPEWMVRAELAKHCLGLAHLINDEDPFVRMEVLRSDFLEKDVFGAHSLYSESEASKVLKKLVEDDVASIRAEVARRGFALGRFIDDPSPVVRYQVARQGYGLKRLSNDSDARVRNEARRIGYGK